jgi:phosphonate transport system substrate-binding protein
MNAHLERAEAPDTTLIFSLFLTSAWHEMAQAMTEYTERCLGIPSLLLHGCILDDFASANVDAGFLDALSYLHLLRQHPCPIELIATSLLQHEEEHDLSSTFFDIVVRQDSALKSPGDIEGCTWAYHRELSHVEDYLVYEQATSPLKIGRAIEVSSQAKALRYVLDGKAEAAVIDSRLFDLVLSNSPGMADRLRILDTYSYALSPLVVVAAGLPATLKQKLRKVFLTVHQHTLFAQRLSGGPIERFVPAANAHYRDTLRWYERSRRKPTSLSPGTTAG